MLKDYSSSLVVVNFFIVLVRVVVEIFVQILVLLFRLVLVLVVVVVQVVLVLFVRLLFFILVGSTAEHGGNPVRPARFREGVKGRYFLVHQVGGRNDGGEEILLIASWFWKYWGLNRFNSNGIAQQITAGTLSGRLNLHWPARVTSGGVERRSLALPGAAAGGKFQQA